MRISSGHITTLAVASLAAAACQPPATSTTNRPTPAGHADALFPSGWRFAPGRPAVTAPHAMIASNSALASAAGVEVLREGGNAVDAAVATGFALAVTYPAAGNIGGGGYMIIRMADGRMAALDYREVAPGSATRDMYIDANGRLTDQSRVGPRSAGVPGAVAGLAQALERYGALPLATVMAPAIRYAAEGFIVDSALSRSLAAAQSLVTSAPARAVFFPGGRPLAPGARLVQPALARSLRLIAARGASAFYGGPVGDSLVAEMQRDGGIITKADLEAYRAVWRQPLRSAYRGDTVLGMPPSSSGGVTMIEILNILETWPSLPRFGSAEYVHDVAESFRRAFIDRNTDLGDPAFVDDPVDRLTSKAYARTVRASILAGRASPSPVPVRPPREGTHTTHYSVVDAAGNAVSTTTTLNALYGSGLYVRGGGFFVNNEMDDFTSRPGVPNMFGLVQGTANAIAPGKRMLSSMAPTIVLDSAGAVRLVVGAAGGPTIITATAQVILDVIDSHMSLADAMAAPRIHEQAWPDRLDYERGGLATAVIDSLRAMGYALHPVGHLANANAVMRLPGARGWAGVVEPRASGGAAGY